MKTFYLCPKCGDPMLSEDTPSHRWRKTCDKRLDHYILLLTRAGNDNVIEELTIAIYMKTDQESKICANWNFLHRELTITEGWRGPSFYVPNEIIPFFEPNLLQYDKLIKKLRTYLIFS